MRLPLAWLVPLTCSLVLAQRPLPPAPDTEWATYLGDRASTQFSPLAQISPDNVHRLEVAWTWEGGDARADKTQIQTNPLMVGGVLYVVSPQLKLAALEAGTGRELWRFDPFATDEEADEEEGGAAAAGVSRGLAYWKGGDEQRLLFGAGPHLHAVDPRTGRLIESFGAGGRVDLRENLGDEPTEYSVIATTPGVIYRDLIILPMRVGEGPAPAAPGPIRAYNVRTGELAWRFHTIPRPGEYGYETWPPDAWQRVGGANVWTGMTVDVERGLVFCPTGSAAFDFWGGDRHGDNLFANCLIALDAATGKRVWHFQFVRHDIWDRDLPAPPNLVTVRREGQEIPAVAQVTKSGHVFVFHRETGEPLFPIEEVAIPTSDLPGELAAATQPLPVKPAPFARQLFTAAEITDLSPESHRAVLERFARLRPHTLFAPPSREGTIIFPGFDGGAEWGGAAVDPDGILYVNSNEMAWVLTMVDAGRAGSRGEEVYLQNCTGCHGPERGGNPAHGIPSLVDVGKRLTAAEVETVIRQGRGVMPGFGFLAADEHDALLAFMLGDTEEGPPDRPGHIDPAETTSRVRMPFTHTGYNRWFDPEGYPAVRPPWGTLNAIDLNTGEYRWRVPLGEFPELTKRGIPVTGAENYGGPVATAGGLIFIAATKDEMIRAFDRRTGRELWKAPLPAGGYATPAVYAVNGRQYVVIACGGGKMGTKSGDRYVAFALPDAIAGR
jgi:quinoprotein glucose dehydrogenase